MPEVSLKNPPAQALTCELVAEVHVYVAPDAALVTTAHAAGTNIRAYQLGKRKVNMSVTRSLTQSHEEMK